MRIGIRLNTMLWCAAVCAASLSAQPAPQAAPGPGGGAALRSPEITPDSKVTFRLSAPLAASVAVRNTTGGFADWPGGNLVALTKDAQGVWSVTIGPLKSEYYSYVFVVDGVATLDPQNPLHMRDGTHYSNALRISGGLTKNYDVNDVPHGTVALVWYPSQTFKASRRAYVYTPPGYETGTARYPVLYLLHGGGGDEDAWTTLGRAPEILDNLIAQGQAKPMIVVMTNENPGEIAAPDFVPVTPAPRGGPEPLSMRGPGMLLFPRSLVTDLVPYIDRIYRTFGDREHRAIAGLSMGGAMTLYAAFNSLDKFAWVGTFSAGLPPMPGVGVPIAPPTNASALRGPDVAQSIDKRRLAELLPQLNADANAKLRLFYVAIGAEDGLITAHNAFKELLAEKGVKATIVETHGYGHEWPFWRICLTDYAARLFQPAR
jgi:enterochelin esterase family protein